MRKLIDDKVQYSNAPAVLKSPALADYHQFTDLTITLASSADIDCVGIGLFDAVTLNLTLNDGTLDYTETITYSKNGLYMLSKTYKNILTIRLQHTGSLMGRFGAGKSRFLGCAPAREPGFYSTYEPRVTASGQVIEGAGGISGRRIGVDFRYKIDSDVYQDFTDAYSSQVAKGYPFFILFDKETHRMPYERMYASTDNNLLFQSSVNKFLYSRRFEYTERF